MLINTPKMIDRNVLLLGWISFFTDMASAMITPLIPVFVIAVLHEGADTLGVIVALATLFSYLLRLFSGYLSDRYGIVKPLVAGGYLLSALSKPLLGLSHTWPQIAALRTLERVGKGLRSAPKDVMIAHYSKADYEGRTFGFHKTLDIAGELTGAVTVFIVLMLFGAEETVLRNLFLLTLFPGLISLALLFFVTDVPKPVAPLRRFRLNPEDRAVIGRLVFYFLFIFFVFSDAYFTLRAMETGFAVAWIPLLYIVSTSVQTLLSYPSGWLIDRVGYAPMFALALAAGVGMQGLLYIGGTLPLWCAYALLGLFTVASLNANRTLISKAARNRGSVYGVFYATVALSAAGGAYVSGLLWEHCGHAVALGFSLSGTTAVFGSYLLWLLISRHR